MTIGLHGTCLICEHSGRAARRLAAPLFILELLEANGGRYNDNL